MINLSSALSAFNSAGINPHDDFHTLSSKKVEVIVDCANIDGYKKPKNAPHSRAHAYFKAIQRKLKCEVNQK